MALGIGFRTVRAHVATLLDELDVANRTEAGAALAVWQAQALRLDARLEAAFAETVISLLLRCSWSAVSGTEAPSGPRLVVTGQNLAGPLAARLVVDGTLESVG